MEPDPRALRVSDDDRHKVAEVLRQPGGAGAGLGADGLGQRASQEPSRGDAAQAGLVGVLTATRVLEAALVVGD